MYLFCGLGMSGLVSREYPRYAIVAVGAVLIRDNKILLVKRGYPPGKDKWSIPGGVVEAGEEIYSAAIRELKEETGIEANPLGIVWICNNVVRDGAGRVQYHYVILDVLFDPNTIDGSLRAGGDVVDAAWVPVDVVMSKDDVSKTVKNLIERINKLGLAYISL
ncbi:MAG: NUDIX hydrolase [Sulfolobales archaeon]